MDRNTKGFKIKLKNDAIDKEKQELVNIFLNDKKVKKYILGRNKSAQKLATVVPVEAFIDDYTEDTAFMGKPIIKSSDVEQDAIVVSCSLAIYPHSALQSLHAQGVKHVLNYLDVVKYSNDSRLSMPFIDSSYKDLLEHKSKYAYIYDRLNDEISRKTFSDILHFRYNKDISYMQGYRVDSVGQYFEDFLALQEGEVFVDAGGYDGQTSIEFIKHCPGYHSIYIFEPSEENLRLAKKNLSGYENVYFIAKGLSDQKDTLRFDTSAGSASSISEEGLVTIEVDTLDNMVDEKITFVKMDIEGAEGLAIEGMKKHITNDHPKLAISVYHKADDFWKIPEQILAIRDDYDLYMRHYTEGTDETVMFFIPKG